MNNLQLFNEQQQTLWGEEIYSKYLSSDKNKSCTDLLKPNVENVFTVKFNKRKEKKYLFNIDNKFLKQILKSR